MSARICRYAFEQGLRPDQVTQLEAFVRKLRCGEDITLQQEEDALGKLRRRVGVLEGRLAEALAYKDLPEHMKGALLVSTGFQMHKRIDSG